ncbi:MAG: hypothetical protein K5894_09920 [Lachnospiraceae bacterium]|nr:hypothetical protein [Lachnospiraceae bacterium]
MISEHLLTGEENARTGREICTYLNITSRELTKAVRKERCEGKPICASTGANPGYYLAANRAEMNRFCKSLYHRAGEIFKTRRECMKLMESFPETEEQSPQTGLRPKQKGFDNDKE